jgi:hypothetical protein
LIDLFAGRGLSFCRARVFFKGKNKMNANLILRIVGLTLDLAATIAESIRRRQAERKAKKEKKRVQHLGTK